MWPTALAPMRKVEPLQVVFEHVTMQSENEPSTLFTYWLAMMTKPSPG